MFLQDDKYKIVLRKQTHITDCHTVHYIEYHRPFTGIDWRNYRRSPRFSGLYRSHCRRRNVIQHHLLDFRFPPYGDERHDLAGLRATWLEWNHPVITPLRRRRSIHCNLSVNTPVSYPKTCIYFYTDDSGSWTTGNHLFLYLYLGSTCHVRVVWICRLVYRNAKFTFPDVYRHYAKYRQYHSQLMPCLSAGHESGRSSYRNPYRPICRVHNGNITIYPLLQQTPQTNCLAGDMAETSYVPLLSGQPGYILPYTLLGYRHYVFHFSRSRTRRDRISRKHIAHAIIHSLFLYHGRFCLCRWSVSRTLYRRKKPTGSP